MGSKTANHIIMKKQTFRRVLAFSATSLFALSVTHAQTPVTVLNSNFDTQVLTPGQTIGEAAPTDWTGFNVGGGGTLGNGYDYGISYAQGTDFTDPLTAPASSGNNYLWVNRWNGNGTQVAGVYQDVGTLLADTTYTLSVAIGQRAGSGPNGSWSPGIISLLNGTDNTGLVLSSSGGLPSTPNTWEDFTTSFTTGSSVNGDLTIELSALDAPSIQADFSNVELTAMTVPEPATTAIAGLGGLALFVFRRRMSP